MFLLNLYRLTASVFAKICKLGESTSKSPRNYSLELLAPMIPPNIESSMKTWPKSSLQKF